MGISKVIENCMFHLFVVWGFTAPDGFHMAGSSLGSWWPIWGWSKDKRQYGLWGSHKGNFYFSGKSRVIYLCIDGLVCLKFCLAGPCRDVGSW